MNLIITMAGLGKRFLDVGYKEPKYKIKVCGHTLFYWAVTSLKNFNHSENNFIFIVRKKDNATEFISSECAGMQIERYKTVELESITDGQATTALYAEDAVLDRGDPVIIYNIDTYVVPEYLKQEDIRGHGWLPCFPGTGDHWSFARKGHDGRVIEVREKKRISTHATIGLYYFESFSLYKQAYNNFYADSLNMEAGEKYIAPLYNQLIKDGKNVYIFEIPFAAVHGLGTPDEVKDFYFCCLRH